MTLSVRKPESSVGGGVVRAARTNAHGVLDVEAPFAAEHRAQRLPFDEWHDEEELPADVAGVEDRNDGRVLQPRRRLDLPQEPVGASRLGHRGQHDLDGDVAAVA